MYQLKLNVDFIIIILENKIMENVIMRKIEDILNKLLVQLFNDILQIEEKSLKNTQFTDLSITEIHTIEAIGLDRSRTMGEIAHDLRITVGTLTTAITKLIKKGYVERKRIEEDRRVVLVNLTSKVLNNQHSWSLIFVVTIDNLWKNRNGRILENKLRSMLETSCTN